MELWFTSDHHFGHENIIRFSQRPFANAREMDEAMIERWNSHVKAHMNHHVYHLGDVTMRRGGRIDREIFIKLIRSLHGHKRLLLGNHDHFPVQTYLDAGFEKIYGTWRGIENILLSHYPVHPTSLGGAKANVHGHTHTHPNEPPVMWVDKKTQALQVRPYINICVEQTEYRPITLGELNDRIRVATMREED